MASKKPNEIIAFGVVFIATFIFCFISVKELWDYVKDYRYYEKASGIVENIYYKKITHDPFKGKDYVYNSLVIKLVDNDTLFFDIKDKWFLKSDIKAHDFVEIYHEKFDERARTELLVPVVTTVQILSNNEEKLRRYTYKDMFLQVFVFYVFVSCFLLNLTIKMLRDYAKNKS